jgi:disulfide bond formation protein DsbB
LLSLLIALIALAGSLWLSMGTGLKACPLCFYQRTFVMGVVAVLAIGLLTGSRHRGVLNLLALPMAIAAVGVAGFHVYLELSGKLECPPGLFEVGSTPQQSLAILLILTGVVAAGVARGARAGEAHSFAGVVGVVFGLLLAWASVASAPPMPVAPKKAYETPFDICRPPYHQP